MQQCFVEAIENMIEDKGPINPDDLDIEVPEELPFVGFNAEIDSAGCSGESIRE